MSFLHKYRPVILAAWGAFFVSVLYIYFAKPEIFEVYLRNAFAESFYLGAFLFLLLGCLRGFFFIPATTIIVLGFLFFSPLVLYALIMVGVMVSSALAYWFARSLEIGMEIEEHSGKQVRFLKRWLARHELPVVILWSGFPFTPTDVICYVCGALKMHFGKFILGIFIGEAVVCAVYIYFGDYLFRSII